ncbi:hypothetical protein Scep_006477 [Stephania cephalantha]|uniref:Uncharacterized protein n=1 Tax=Stephania cephalantha TaxID=152367 RepID=A0AAP0KAS1_9MAGN
MDSRLSGPPPPPPKPPLSDLAASLERVTHMATQLLASSDPSHALQLYSALDSLHSQIALFLAQFDNPVTVNNPQFPHSVSFSVVADQGAASASRAVLGGLLDSTSGVDLANKRRRTSDDRNQEEPVLRD